ncbi:MAG: hypothetical protein QG591_1389, partial [Planctomycetota bacterium]|nr:hypothetical protein [Planctomycetota bacterium]
EPLTTKEWINIGIITVTIVIAVEIDKRIRMRRQRYAGMPIIHISEELQIVLKRISGICFKAETVLNLCIEGFMKDKVDLIDRAQEQIGSMDEEGKQLRKLLSNKAAGRSVNNDHSKSLLATLSSIGLMLNGLDAISRHIRFKIGKRIIFNDKGVEEIRCLFYASLDVVKMAGDTLANGSELSMKHVVDKSTRIEKLAGHYAEKHKEQLITGICTPEASLLYINIADGILTVVWHLKKAVTRLFGHALVY